MTTTTELAPPTDLAAAVQDDEDRAIARAEATWRTLSEAIDRAGEAGRMPFLVRLTMLTALDHLTPERFAALVAEAERTA